MADTHTIGQDVATATAARMADQDAAVTAPDTLARVARAADAAARTYRLRRYGADPADVMADVVADMLADAYAGRAVDVGPAAIGQRARRTADTYRRRAMRETPTGTATETTGEAAPADGPDPARQRAAVAGRRPRTLQVHRADVLAVGDYARHAMRPAEWAALARADRAAVAAAMADPWLPARPAERDAWAALAVADQTAAYRADPARPVAVEVLRELPATTARQRAVLRVAYRTARRWTDAAVAWRDRAEWPTDTGDAADALAAAVVGVRADLAGAVVDACRAVENVARHAYRDAVALAFGRRPRVGAAPAVAVEARPVPAGGPADALAAGYVPETLAANRTANRPAGALVTARHVGWADAAPTATAATRAALGRAARTWAARVLAAPRLAADVVGQTAAYRADAADALADTLADALPAPTWTAPTAGPRGGCVGHGPDVATAAADPVAWEDGRGGGGGGGPPPPRPRRGHGRGRPGRVGGTGRRAGGRRGRVVRGARGARPAGRGHEPRHHAGATGGRPGRLARPRPRGGPPRPRPHGRGRAASGGPWGPSWRAVGPDGADGAGAVLAGRGAVLVGLLCGGRFAALVNVRPKRTDRTEPKPSTPSVRSDRHQDGPTATVGPAPSWRRTMFLVAAILHALAHPRHRAEVGPLTVYRFEANPITGRFEERRVS